MGGGRSAALIRFALLSVRAGGAEVLALGAGPGAGVGPNEHCAKSKQLASATTATPSLDIRAVARTRKRARLGCEVMGTFCASFGCHLTISSRSRRCGRLDRCCPATTPATGGRSCRKPSQLRCTTVGTCGTGEEIDNEQGHSRARPVVDAHRSSRFPSG